MEKINPEIEKLTSELNSLFDRNKETVEIYNIVKLAETNCKLEDQKSIFKNNRLNILLGFIVLISLLFMLSLLIDRKEFENKSYIKLVENPINNDTGKINLTKELIPKNSNSINSDTSNKINLYTNSKKNTQIKEINVKDSVVKSYILTAEVSKYSIFEINRKIVNLLKLNGIKVIKSESNSVKSKIITEIKQGYSETYNQIINYNFEYDISYDEPDIQVKLKLINKNRKIKINKNQLSKLPNSTETKFYNLMKVNIDSLY